MNNEQEEMNKLEGTKSIDVPGNLDTASNNIKEILVELKKNENENMEIVSSNPLSYNLLVNFLYKDIYEGDYQLPKKIYLASNGIGSTMIVALMDEITNKALYGSFVDFAKVAPPKFLPNEDMFKLYVEEFLIGGKFRVLPPSGEQFTYPLSSNQTD